MRHRITMVCAAVLLLPLNALCAEEVVSTSVINLSMEERFEQMEQEISWLKEELHKGGGDSKYSDCGCESGCSDCCVSHRWYLSISAAWNARERATEVDAPGTFLEFTDGFGINAALGVRLHNWRVEAEASYLNNYVEFASAETEAGTFGGPADGNVGVQLFMLNVYRDFCLTDRIRPYVGAGIGTGQSEINGLRPSIFAGTDFELEGINATSDWPFAYQFRGGVSYALGCRTEAFFGYRYVNVSKFEFTHFPFGEFRPNGSRNHNVEAGIRVNF